MRRNLPVFLILICLLSPSSMLAEVIVQKTAPRPTTGATAPARIPEAKLISHVLANGLEVIILEDHSIPLVTIEFAVRNGSYTEPPELNGLSHLYEHMFFKRSRTLAGSGRLGIAYNGTTREEVVNYFFTTVSPNISTAMQFMKDSARYPLFDEGEFAREKQVVIGELDRKESNPLFHLQMEMNKRLFFKYPSRKNPLGNRVTVNGATSDTMRLIQHRYYVPNNAALIVTGDVNPTEVLKMAQEMYGDWPRREKDPFVEFPVVEHPPLPKSEGAVIIQPVQNVIIQISWHGPSIGKDDQATYAADVFSFILSQPNSRFQKNLVDSGLVAGLEFGYYTQRSVGPIFLNAQTTPDKARAAIKALYDEVAHFNDKDYYTDEQLESAKALLEADDLYSREKLSEYTHNLSFWWASTSIEYFRGYLPRLRATSRADIDRYITTYIQGKPHVGLALMSGESQARIKIQPQELIGNNP